jgi:hypothetical protein
VRDERWRLQDERRIFEHTRPSAASVVMDPNALIGMVFTLILVLMIGGFIVLMPLTRRLGLLLEQRLANRQPVQPPSDGAQLEELRRTIDDMRAELDRLAQRQDFVDGLLAEPGKTYKEKLTP